MEATCAVPTPITPAGVVLSAALFVANPIPYIPQLLKLRRTRSAAGVSLVTNILTVCLCGTNAAAATLVKAKQIRACSTDGWGCVPDLLDGLTVFALAVCSCALLGLTLCFPPLNSASSIAAGVTTMVAVLCLWVASFAIDFAAPCSRGALDLAEVLAYVGAACAIVQYTPQLVTTVKQRGSGSLSVTFYLLQAAGGLIIFADEAFVTSDRWPVWAPLLFSTIMQLAIALLAACFDCAKSASASPGRFTRRNTLAWATRAQAPLLPGAADSHPRPRAVIAASDADAHCDAPAPRSSPDSVLRVGES
jgi:uncharacterized protein with PQ loop repeat